jgi:hypothetical protein
VTLNDAHSPGQSKRFGEGDSLAGQRPEIAASGSRDLAMRPSFPDGKGDDWSTRQPAGEAVQRQSLGRRS